MRSSVARRLEPRRGEGCSNVLIDEYPAPRCSLCSACNIRYVWIMSSGHYSDNFDSGMTFLTACSAQTFSNTPHALKTLCRNLSQSSLLHELDAQGAHIDGGSKITPIARSNVHQTSVFCRRCVVYTIALIRSRASLEPFHSGPSPRAIDSRDRFSLASHLRCVKSGNTQVVKP